ncbi:uncharacterized protein C2orf81 homolog isoform X2 [Passer domesticus]|uniref:uncharacterized protein C2orf81 homolog isoform X2 n=1 Tax=Passer domesticus TaxID=48849 RepID=UPI0030FE0E11
MSWGPMLGCTAVYWSVLVRTGMHWGELGGTGLYWSVLVRTGAHRAAPRLPVSRQRAKPHGSGGGRPKQDKPRTPGRAEPRHAKKGSAKSPGRAEPAAEPREPLDVRPLLDELLERAVTRSALAAVARQRVPFAVARARDAILFVAEWCFVVRDSEDPRPERDTDPEGDTDPERDGVWKEDEEPPPQLWDSCTPGVAAVVSVPSEEELSEELSATAEVPPVGPGDVPGAAAARDVAVSPRRVPPGDVPAAAVAEGPLGQDTALRVAVPPGQPRAAAAGPAPRRPEPSTAPQPPRRGRRPSRAPERGPRPSRPPRPRAAPPAAPRPPAPPPAPPAEPAAPAAQEPRQGDQEAPPPSSSSSRSSVPSVQPRRLSRSPGVARLGARRGATRWVLPEVRVVDASGEPERGWAGASRSRLPLPGSLQVLPGPGRVAKGQPRLCDPWLASARLAPGVTVRWGGSERRGPAPVGHGGDEQGDEALGTADEELKPILADPECRLSEYKEEELENLLGAGLLLPGAGPAPEGLPSPRVSPVPGLAPGVAPWDAPGARGSVTAPPKRAEVNKKY